MRVINLTAEIGDDHCLNLQLPNEVPSGIVEIITLITDKKSVCESPSLEELTDHLQEIGINYRAKEEIISILKKNTMHESVMIFIIY
jgi:hypothetical protein